MSADLSVEMTEMLEFSLIIYCAGAIIFSIFVLSEGSGVSPISVTGMVIGVIHAALPMDYINSIICPVPLAPPNE